MFNIYFENRFVSIRSDQEPAPENFLLFRLNGLERPQDLSTILRPFEEGKSPDSLVLLSPDPFFTIEAIRALYKNIEAAGGIVFNDDEKLLMIYRNEVWDLPKGKIEPGEEISHAAIREVSEETGIKGLHIDKKCRNSFHIYSLNKKCVLKHTHWFRMHTADQMPLQPQVDEGITKAQWMNEVELKKAVNNCYASITNLLLEEKIIS